MTKKRLLEEAIIKITQQAGLQMSGKFHLTSVSRDAGGVFIMEVMWRERKRLCEVVKRVVTGFPSDPESSCIVLLPEVADQMILAAQCEPADFLPASGQTSAGEALIDLHRTGDENVTQM